MSLPPKTAEIPLRVSGIFGMHHGEGPHQFLSSKAVKALLKEADFHLIEHRGTLLIPVGPRFIRKWGEGHRSISEYLFERDGDSTVLYLQEMSCHSGEIPR